MKKVCIVTWSGGTNYGTNLQAYALIEKLRLLGYDTSIKGKITGNLNYFLHPTFVADRVTAKLKVRENKKKPYDEDKIKEKRFSNFCREYLPRLNSNGREEWKRIENDYIAFITGSDQVWNPNYFNSMMMLDFVKTKKIKKIAYAQSIGVNSLSKATKAKYKRLLSSYSAIGMRESQAANLISDISPVRVETVLDPTLLLSSKDWDKLAIKAEVDEALETDKPYILCYFVGHRTDYNNFINRVKEQTGWRCIIIPMDVNLSSCGKVVKGVGPMEFITLIKNASIVCTDSFHATVFSILYQREFYVLKRFSDRSKESQNSRLYEILTTLNLINRLILDERRFHRDSVIDYNIVYKTLNSKRKHSEKFLINALEMQE